MPSASPPITTLLAAGKPTQHSTDAVTLSRAQAAWSFPLVAAVAAAIIWVVVWLAAATVPAVLVTSDNIWFESDTADVFDVMTSRGADYHRLILHPLFLWFAYLPIGLLRHGCGLGAVAAVHVWLATVAAIWTAVFAWLLHRIGCRLLDTVLLLGLATVSAATLFGSLIPETYPLGSLGFLLALALAVRPRGSALRPILVTVLCLGTTVTNVVAAVWATVFTQPLRQALRVLAIGGVVVVTLWLLQQPLFPTPWHIAEGHNILAPRAGGPVHVLRSFVYHTLIMPEITVRPHDGKAFVRTPQDTWKPVPQRMVTQPSSPGSASVFGRVAVLAWTALLLLGAWGLCTAPLGRLPAVLGATLLCQMLLHVLYGDETFLYALHFLPLLLLVAAAAFLTPWRPVARWLLVVLILGVTVNNVAQFQAAVAFTHTITGQH